MAKYLVSLPFHCTALVTVKANSQEEAEKKALNEACPTVCCHCSRDIEIGEFDEELADFISVERIER